MCVQMLLDSQFQSYVDGVNKASCAAELRRYLQRGPPLYLSDPNGLPCDSNRHVARLWFSSSNTERDAKVKDALEGEARQKMWDDMRALHPDEALAAAAATETAPAADQAKT
eukprot:m.87055 g.87055  ORF g.87055 m.87055 type:complete len:112 (-) comp15120_c1_seq3:524-859(-)